MNLTKNLTLVEVIELVVSDAIDKNHEFSIYDVTCVIRELVNNGTYAIPAYRVYGERYQYKIEHDDVRNVFLDLYRTNTWPELTSKNSGAGYVLYYSNASSNDTLQSSVPPSRQPQSEIDRRVELYLRNCYAAGVVPTYRKLQSAIKRGRHMTGLKISQLRDIVNRLGYSGFVKDK